RGPASGRGERPRPRCGGWPSSFPPRLGGLGYAAAGVRPSAPPPGGPCLPPRTGGAGRPGAGLRTPPPGCPPSPAAAPAAGRPRAAVRPGRRRLLIRGESLLSLSAKEDPDEAEAPPHARRRVCPRLLRPPGRGGHHRQPGRGVDATPDRR